MESGTVTTPSMGISKGQGVEQSGDVPRASAACRYYPTAMVQAGLCTCVIECCKSLFLSVSIMSETRLEDDRCHSSCQEKAGFWIFQTVSCH